MAPKIDQERVSSAVFWVSGVVDALRADGLDVGALLETAGVDPATLDDRDARVPTERVGRLWRAAVERSGNPWVGLSAARVPRPALFDVVGYAMLSSANLRGVLAQIVRYIRIVSDAATVAVKMDGDGYRLTLDLVGGEADLPWQRYTFDLLSSHSFLRWVTADMLGPLAIELNATPDENERPPPEILGGKVRFGCKANALLFAPSDVDLPLPTAQPKLAPIHEQVAEQHLARLNRPPTSERVSEAILRGIVHGEPSRAGIARTLGMSERTMQRRLEAEGSSFRQILDETRKELAKHYMSRDGISLAEAAYLIGFNDQSSFFKATRRWFGMTPKQYRLQPGTAIRPEMMPDGEP